MKLCRFALEVIGEGQINFKFFTFTIVIRYYILEDSITKNREIQSESVLHPLGSSCPGKHVVRFHPGDALIIER
jgi:hypothetical protein